MEFEEKNEKIHFNRKKSDSVDDEKVGFYIFTTFFVFIFIWIMILMICGVAKSPASVILFIPIVLFFLGMINSYDIADDKIEENVFSTTFATMGLIISMPLVAHYNKERENKYLNHVIYMAMILTLFSNFHFWTDEKLRHVCKITRSCFETMSIALYAYTLLIYFIFSTTKKNEFVKISLEEIESMD